jgi:small nuclear ribonucleoprotein (snRNP)-like protein
MNKEVDCEKLHYYFLDTPVRLVLKGGRTAEGLLVGTDKSHFYLKDATYYVTRRVNMLAVPRNLVELVASRAEQSGA